MEQGGAGEGWTTVLYSSAEGILPSASSSQTHRAMGIYSQAWPRVVLPPYAFGAGSYGLLDSKASNAMSYVSYILRPSLSHPHVASFALLGPIRHRP